MGIFQRTTDILAANVNDLIDRFEEPERMLRHALREIETLVATTSSAVARSIAIEKLLAKTRDEHSAQADEWQRRAATAVDAGDEPLARRAIARKLDHQQAVSGAERQLAAARETNRVLLRQLDLLRDKHASARGRLMMLTARQMAAGAQRQMFSSILTPSGQGRALARFERFYQQVEFAQAEAAALVELETQGDGELESEFDRRAVEGAIDDELARLKESRNGVDHGV
jgi:phage shock protein A